MKITAKSRFQLRLASASFVALTLLLSGLLLWLSKLYYAEVDLTRSGRNSLSDSTIAVIKRLDKPLKITAFTDERPDLRDDISTLIHSYQRYKDDITLSFVDPNNEPDLARAAGIRNYGQLLLEYQGSHETLSRLSEESLTNTLMRLGHRKERWIVFLDGHGERHPDRQANFDLSKWAEHMRQSGFRARALSLAENPQIPRNTSVMVIAGPRTKLLKGEIKEIQRYIKKGGNLLWLVDPGPGPLQGLDQLAETLGIEIEAGTLVDPTSQKLTGHATALVISEYSNHPAVANFHDNTIFPNACGISMSNNNDMLSKNKNQREQTANEWRRQVLIDTRPSTWSETGALDHSIRFDRGKDIPGPLNLAISATRQLGDLQQRVIVICDGDFVANSFVMGNGGNLDFAMSIINWLSHDDAYINIPVRIVSDQLLNLSMGTRRMLMLFFVFGLPLAMVASGLGIWLRRRKR